MLSGRSGDDVIWGDGTVGASSPEDASLVGGADRFVFAATDGQDTVMDFRGAEGDLITLASTGLVWGDLDNNGNGVHEDDDAFVAVQDGSIQLDLGAAAGSSRAGQNVVTLAGVDSLGEGNLDFL